MKGLPERFIGFKPFKEYNKEVNKMASKFQDLTSRTYGRLTVIRRVENAPGSPFPRWLCKCECGNETIVRGDYLRHGITKSCGCYRKDKSLTSHRIHGQYKTRLYRIWARMKTRCLTPTADGYENYGARGIKICDEWRDSFKEFYDWAMSHGYDDTKTIDRIDNDGNYEPGNCHWATRREQSNNTRRTIHLTIQGKTHTISEWADISGICRTTIYNRYRNCWPSDKILEGARLQC